MNKPMYKRYAEYEPCGVAYISGTFGLCVYKPDEIDRYDCDYVCSWHNGDNEWGYHKHMVHYTTSGKAYIRKGSIRIYFDEILRA